MFLPEMASICSSHLCQSTLLERATQAVPMAGRQRTGGRELPRQYLCLAGREQEKQGRGSPEGGPAQERAEAQAGAAGEHLSLETDTGGCRKRGLSPQSHSGAAAPCLILDRPNLPHKSFLCSSQLLLLQPNAGYCSHTQPKGSLRL